MSPSANIFEVLLKRAPSLQKLAIETPEGRRIGYGELFAQAGRMARALVDLGVEPGDRVAAQIDKSPEAIMLALACFAAGAALLPLNTAYTLTEIQYFLTDAEPALTLVRPKDLAAIRSLAAHERLKRVESLGSHGEGTFLDFVRAARSELPPVRRAKDDLAAILYTSGTTGRSKGAMLTHENLTSNAEALAGLWRFAADDVLIHALPVFHTHGLFVATNVALFSGATLLFQPKFDADLVLASFSRATTMMGVPTFYVRLLEHEGLTRDATKTMRLFVAGSAPLLAETHERWRERTGHAILERYGMTETNMITSNPYDGDRVAGTVGFPLPGVSLRIADPETGAVLQKGAVGVIEVKGPNVFKGYWRMPEKTAAEFRADGFFITGDLGEIDERDYVRIVGRAKDLVISGGYNVYPKEVEGEIDAIPGVAESAVIGVAHKDFGEGVTAIVVREKGAALDESGVLAALKGRLASYKQPKRVLFVDELPRNTMGKVQKAALRATYAALYD
jgi:malonyl-CoA/methylmalonyl-CoA synthetase